jgi:hypothetical protein
MTAIRTRTCPDNIIMTVTPLYDSLMGLLSKETLSWVEEWKNSYHADLL